jgi:hypothetical protein
MNHHQKIKAAAKALAPSWAAAGRRAAIKSFLNGLLRVAPTLVTAVLVTAVLVTAVLFCLAMSGVIHPY